MKSTIHLSPGKHLDNISKMFKKLYNDEQLTDVTLWCKDGTIRAHKLILATSSPYFHRIFTENIRDHPVLIMHGVSYQNLHDLVELIYKGNVEVLAESVNPLYELAGELQLTGLSGVLREEGEKIGNSSNESFKCSEGSSHGRDTRFKGLKRVAVDYKGFEDAKIPQKKPCDNTPNPSREYTTDQSTPVSRFEPTAMAKEQSEGSVENGDTSNELVVKKEIIYQCSAGQEELPKLTAWAKKQRKFKCDLCPSSFKRSSHLSRHQLVHTGERPFACNQCEKAFSRHDKLKHHIRKTHEAGYDTDYNMEVCTTSASAPTYSPPPFVISHVRTEVECDQNPPKRPRGRPRKHPVVEKPQIKRGRGRPRLNPVRQGVNGENYDITNLPYGDLDYLTMPLAAQCDDSVMIEPLVEIKTDATEKDNNETEVDGKKGNETTPPESCGSGENQTNLKVLESKIAEIGECTISVANH